MTKKEFFKLKPGDRLIMDCPKYKWNLCDPEEVLMAKFRYLEVIHIRNLHIYFRNDSGFCGWIYGIFKKYIPISKPEYFKEL